MDIRKQIVYKKTSDLKPYEKNPRKNDDAVQYVANSIKEFNFQSPIIIDKDGVIVCGHTRWKAAKKLGLKTVPCIMADDLTPEQIKAFRLADNKAGEIAEWDFELLDEELSDIIDIDMSVFGFEEEEKERIPENTQEDEYNPQPPVNPKSKKGQIYKLGIHRLMCGDSTNADDIDALMDGEKADLVVTDPPYNVAVGDSNQKYAKEAAEHGWNLHTTNLMNDKMSDIEFHDFIKKAMTQMKETLKPGAAYYIWHSVFMQSMLENILKELKVKPRQQLIWNKNEATLGRQDYQWKHEPCFYGWREDGTHYFIDDRTKKTVFEDDIPDFSKMKKEDLVKILQRICSPDNNTTVLRASKMMNDTLHPTMKPVKLLAHLIYNSSHENDNVLDLFGGSGSTMIACEQLNRRCFMMELDPKYVDVIIDRYERFTGKTAELIQEGDSHDGED